MCNVICRRMELEYSAIGRPSIRARETATACDTRAAMRRDAVAFGEGREPVGGRDATTHKCRRDEPRRDDA